MLHHEMGRWMDRKLWNNPLLQASSAQSPLQTQSPVCVHWPHINFFQTWTQQTSSMNLRLYLYSTLLNANCRRNSIAPFRFSSTPFFLKTIWLQWCVVWLSAHPAALSLLGPRSKTRTLVCARVCVFVCMLGNHARKRETESERLAPQRERNISFSSICGELELPLIDFVMGVLLSGAETTAHCSKLPRKPQSYPVEPGAPPSLSLLSVWVHVLVFMWDCKHVARPWPR